MRGKIVAGVAASALLAGCASIFSAGDDDVEIQLSGSPDAQCEVKTFDGQTISVISAPGMVEVPRDTRPLTIQCQRDGYEVATTTIDSGHSYLIWLNLLWPGLLPSIVGAVVDVATDNHVTYPEIAVVYMARERRNDRNRSLDDFDRMDDFGGERRPMARSTGGGSDGFGGMDDFGGGQRPMRPGGGGFDTSNAAVYLGFASVQSQADGTAEFMWLAESDLLGDARPVVQQRIDPGTGLPRFHIFGADLPRFDAEAVCEGLESRGYLCRVVDAQS